MAEERKDKMAERELNSKVINHFFSKFITGYIILVSMIMFFELVMILRGLFVFDFSNWRHVGYFISYILLVLVSIPVLVILVMSKRRNTVLNCVSIASNAYALSMIVWSAMVSYLDMVGHHTFIIYLTVIMGVAALTVINPKAYISVVVPISAILLFMAYNWGSELVRTSGYMFNYIVFVTMSIMITIRQFSMAKREYLDRNKLEEMSFHDELTGLKNRNALADDIKSFNGNLSFGVIDIDDFKELNDHHGHDYGDHCLTIVGKSLKNYFGDNVYRFGGDEFIVVSSLLSKEDLKREFNKVNEILYVRFQNRDVSISGGFVVNVDNSTNYDVYFKRADSALYKAKTNGKRQAVIE